MRRFTGLKNRFCIQIVTFLVLQFGVLPQLIGSETEASNSQYQIEIPMKSQQGQNAQVFLIQQALGDLLVRLSGTETILEKPMIKNAISRADQYSKQISYHQPNPGLRTVRVQFKEAAIKNLIAQAREKMWDSKKPLTLAMLTLNQGKHATWIGQDFAAEAMQEIQTLAAKRGLLIVFPMLDLTDTNQISESDVQQANLEKLKTVGTRYHSDVIWSGEITEAQGENFGKFIVIKPDKQIEFETKGETLSILLNNTLEQLSQMIKDINPSVIHSELNSNATNLPTKPIMLTITDSLDGERYVKVMNYLHRLPTVTEVTVAQISSEKTIFNIESSYTKEEMASIIAKDSLLIDNSMSYPSTDGNLIYKLSEAL